MPNFAGVLSVLIFISGLLCAARDAIPTHAPLFGWLSRRIRREPEGDLETVSATLIEEAIDEGGRHAQHEQRRHDDGLMMLYGYLPALAQIPTKRSSCPHTGA